MSIRRRTNIDNVNFWVTNNSNDVNVVGSLRWCVQQTLGINNMVIKVHPDFVDVEGIGKKLWIRDTRIVRTGSAGGINNNARRLEIDINNFDVDVTTGLGFSLGNNTVEGGGGTSAIVKNLRFVAEDNTITGTSALNTATSFDNCTVDGLTFNGDFMQYNSGTYRRMVFRNTNAIVSVIGSDMSQDTIFEECIFENLTNLFFSTIHRSPTWRILIKKCYFSIGLSLVNLAGSMQHIFENCFFRNIGTGTNVAIYNSNPNCQVINCTLVDVRFTTGVSMYDTGSFIIRHCTQLYTLPIAPSTVLNIFRTTFSQIVQNNIIISPNSNNVFTTGLTDLTESGNLYLCVNANAQFPNSIHYPADTPLSTLIDTNQQGLGETFKRYYLPTITDNVTRLGDVLLNQIEENRTNPTNSGAI